MVWRRDDENPLLSALVEIAGELSSARGDGGLMLIPHRSIQALAWTRIERSPKQRRMDAQRIRVRASDTQQ